MTLSPLLNSAMNYLHWWIQTYNLFTQIFNHHATTPIELSGLHVKQFRDLSDISLLKLILFFL